MRKMNDEKTTLSQGVDYRCVQGPKYKRYALILLTWLFAMGANAQFVVTPNPIAADLAQTLAGAGVTITNATRGGDVSSVGTFINSGNSLGLTGGVILSSGRVINAARPSNINSSTSLSSGTDAQLQTLTNAPVNDKALLEFDIVPQGNILKFEYVFMSEEYPEWVCSQYNDVFGFFISGQKPSGGNYVHYNIARIPNSTLPVAINAINQGSRGQYGIDSNCMFNRGSLAYPHLFRSNLTPVINQDIVFDGMTVVLTATVSVIPCRTYHLKLVVGDVGDKIFDSGVMIQANSITSLPVTITSEGELNYAGYSSAYEGCVKGKFKFSIPAVQPTDVSVNVQIGGTATAGVDYPAISPLVIIPAGQTSTEITVLPIQDNTAEADETITISTVDPCSGDVLSSASMLIKDDVQASITASTGSVCSGQSVQLSAAGGVSFSWSPATGLDNATSGTPLASPLATTTYTANMSWGSCNKTASTTISVGGPSISFNTAIAPVICNGTPMQIAASAGSGTYNYSWSNGVNDATTTVTSAGTYQVTASDNLGCSSTASISVDAAAMNVTGSVSNATCSGGNDGAINLSVSGSNSLYSYLWNNNAQTQTLSNLTPGTYQVTVTNADGCSAVQSFNVAQSGSNISADLSVVNPTCFGSNNGSIAVTVNGGTAPYSFNWGSGITTQNRTNLSAGTYTVTVADFSGCNVVKSVTLTQLPGITINPVKVNADCATGTAGSINLNVSGGAGGFSYTWNDNNTNQHRTGLNAGTYNVVVADANGCTAVASSTISTSGSISANFNYAGTYCAPAAAVSFTHAGTQNGVSHYWSFGNNTSSVQASPAYTYTTPDNYNVVHVVSNSVCTDTVRKIVAIKAQPVISPSVTQIPCNGGGEGAITLNVSNGLAPYSFNWGNGITMQNRSNLSVGDYSVTVTDNNACSASFATSIVQGAAITVSETHTNVTCHSGTNGNIDITATGGIPPYNFRWSNGEMLEDLNNIGAANYIVTVTDARDCSVAATIDVTQPQALQLAIDKVDASCFGTATGSLHANVTGGTQPMVYNWTGNVNSQSLNNIGAGVYTLSVTDAAGCGIAASATVAQATQIVINETTTNTSCKGGGNGSISLSATGGAGSYTYMLNSTAVQQVVNGLQAGTYHTVVADVNGCTQAKDIVITEPAAMEIVAAISNEKCGSPNTGKVELTVNGGNAPYLYAWNNNAATATVNNLGEGTYVVTVTDAKGCKQVKANIVHASQPLLVSTTVNTLPCNVAKGEALISVDNGVAPYTFQWTNGDNTATLKNVQPGTYNVTIRDAAGCALDTSVTILNTNSFKVEIEGAGHIELGETVDLKATSTGSDEVSYTWVPAFGLQCPSCANVTVRPAETTTYKVTAIDAIYGCTAIAEATVQVGTDNTVFIPNAFTPNGDGQNDLLQLYGSLQGIRYFQLLVFNRWGEKVYETNDQFFAWDAIYKGEKLEPAAYLYVMKVVHLNNETSRTFKGSITLLK